MSGLVLYIQFLLDVVDLLAIIGLDRLFHIPLTHLRVNKQRGISVATAVKGGMQWPQTQFRLCHDRITLLDFTCEQIRQLVDSNNRDRWNNLPLATKYLPSGEVFNP